jgi:hypothetical protein
MANIPRDLPEHLRAQLPASTEVYYVYATDTWSVCVDNGTERRNWYISGEYVVRNDLGLWQEIVREIDRFCADTIHYPDVYISIAEIRAARNKTELHDVFVRHGMLSDDFWEMTRGFSSDMYAGKYPISAQMTFSQWVHIRD